MADVAQRARAWLPLLICLGVLLAPSLAEACPFCAGRNEGGAGRYAVIGAMIATPFVIVGVTAPLLLRWLRGERNEEDNHG